MNKELQTQTIEQVFENYKSIKERLRDKTPQCFEFINTKLEESNSFSNLFISLKMKRFELDFRIKVIFLSTSIEVQIIYLGKEKYDFFELCFIKYYSEDEKDIVDFISHLYEEINKCFFEKMKAFFDLIENKNKHFEGLLASFREYCGYNELITDIALRLKLLGAYTEKKAIETMLKDEIFKEYQKNLAIDLGIEVE